MAARRRVAISCLGALSKKIPFQPIWITAKQFQEDKQEILFFELNSSGG